MTTSAQKRAARQHYPAYVRSTDYSLGDAYGRYSSAKASAWRYCEELCEKHSGWGLKVIGHSSHFFSAGFKFADPETGVVMFMYIAPTFDQSVEV